MSGVQPLPEPEVTSHQLPTKLYEKNISDVGYAFLGLTSILAWLEGKYDKSLILEIAKSFVKKNGLPDSLIPLMVSFAIESTEVLNGKPLEIEQSIQEKKEYRADSLLDSGRGELPPKVVEEKKEYKVYSHEHPKGEPISNRKFEQILNDYKDGSDFLFLIYQQKETGFYYSEICKTKIDQREIRALKYFIKNPQRLITHTKIYGAGVVGQGDYQEPLTDEQYGNVYTMIKVLRKKTSRKMRLFLITIHGKGYKFVTIGCPEFYLFELLPTQV